MNAFVRDVKSFSAVARLEVLSYELHSDSVSSDSGSVTVLGELPRSIRGDWLIINGDIYFIDSVSPGSGKAQISVLPPICAFSRTIFYRGPFSSIGEALRMGILSGFVHCPDAEYSRPYISVSNSDTTEFVQPILSDGGLWSVRDYAEEVRQGYGVEVSFALTNAGLACAIQKRAQTVHNLVFDDGHSQLISAVLGEPAMVKCSVWQGDAETIFYRHADGSISTTAPAPRIDGMWGNAIAKEDDSVAEIAAATFRKTKMASKIVFRSDRNFAVYDKIRMRLSEEVVETFISAVIVSSSDIRTQYVAGDMPTSLSDKLREANLKIAEAEAKQKEQIPITVEKIPRSQTMSWLDTWRHVSQNRAWNTNRVWKYHYLFEGYSTVVGRLPEGATSTIMIPLDQLRCEGHADSLQLSMEVSSPANIAVDVYGWAVTTARHDRDYEGIGDLQSADMIGHGTFVVPVTRGIEWRTYDLPCEVPADTDLYVYLFGTANKINDFHIYRDVTVSLVDTVERIE